MLEIIKSVRICNKFNLSLIRFDSTKCYEVQYSNDDIILDTDGLYRTKREGKTAFRYYLKTLIVDIKQ